MDTGPTLGRTDIHMSQCVQSVIVSFPQCLTNNTRAKTRTISRKSQQLQVTKDEHQTLQPSSETGEVTGAPPKMFLQEQEMMLYVTLDSISLFNLLCCDQVYNTDTVQHNKCDLD